jgi:hypothetical protein
MYRSTSSMAARSLHRLAIDIDERKLANAIQLPQYVWAGLEWM